MTLSKQWALSRSTPWTKLRMCCRNSNACCPLRPPICAFEKGPLYAPDNLLALASEEKVTLWSQGAIRDAEKWSLDVSDVASLIGRALRQGT